MSAEGDEEKKVESFDICDYLDDYYTRLNESENNVIRKYLEQESQCEQIHSKMRKCLSTLNKFETMLSGLKDNLNDIGKSVSHVGVKTENINHSMEQRIQLRTQLRQYVDDVTISPTMIEVLTNETPNNQAFIEQLHDLMHKIQTIHNYDHLESGPVEDTRSVIKDITDIANKKIKNYLLQRIEHCRKQTTNYTIIQSSLLTYNFLYHFLQCNDAPAANEILKSYMDIMQNLYYTLMKSYISSLTRLLDTSLIPSINQLLGSNYKTNLSKSVPNSTYKVDIGDSYYSLGDRHKVLNEELFSDSLIPHMIVTQQQLPMETIFRSLLYAILSNCFNELDFMNDFFKLSELTETENFFDTIFGRCFQYFLGSMDKFLAQHLDFVGLILCIGITSRYLVVTTSKKLTMCSKYLVSMLDLLWFRFGEVINFNLASLSTSTDNENFQIVNLLPSDITCRCANAVTTLLAVKGNSSFKKMEDNVSSVYKEWRSFIEKVSNEFHIKTDRLIFLGNNLYYMMEAIQNVKAVQFPQGFSFKGANTSQPTFKQIILDEITTDIDVIVNEIISFDIDKRFSFCIDNIRKFRKINDLNLNQDNHSSLNNTQNKTVEVVTEFITEFASDWKPTLKNTVNRYKVLFFAVALNNKLIQRYLNRFVQSYNSVADFSQNSELSTSISDLIPTAKLIDLQVIMVEIKKYTDMIV